METSNVFLLGGVLLLTRYKSSFASKSIIMVYSGDDNFDTIDSVGFKPE